MERPLKKIRLTKLQRKMETNTNLKKEEEEGERRRRRKRRRKEEENTSRKRLIELRDDWKTSSRIGSSSLVMVPERCK